MFKKLTLLIALVIGLCWCFTQEVQAQNVPDEYIYFDLAAGNVNISKTTYLGYVYVNGVKTTVSGTHSGSRKYYVYQSSSVTGSYDKDHTGYANNDDFSNKRNVRIPDYTAITGGGNTWEEFCTNNTDVRTVSTTWNASSTMAGRTCCENRILINLEGGTESDLCDITIDNLWSEYSNFDETNLSESVFRARGEGGIYNYNGGYTVLRMKNHSKFHSICFPKESSVPGYFKFTSFTGDGSTSGSITLTLLKGDDFSEEECLNSTSLIGGWYYENKRTPTSDLIFNGGTIYAGVENHVAKGPHICPTAIGGGACETGEVTINGGNVTAVTSSTAAAIGGGGGIGGVGKTGTVTITGGMVYAYNYGLYVDFYSADMEETLTAGASGTAIGGGSTVGWANSGACLGGEGNVTITGGEVFALSVGGNAIGGGNSYRIGGGTGTINISGGNIIAKSVAGDIGSTHWTPSTAIGGGTGGVREGSGGDAIVNISGNPVILTGSIGGGKTSNATGKIGTAQVRISGNPDVSGQFILAAGSAVDPYFEMKGGIIHNSSTFDEVYYKVKEDGGAVYLENGKVSIQGGTIDNCKAKSGGAVYMTAGEFEMTGGTIKGGEATVNGGAVCMAAGEFTLSGGEIGVNEKPNKAQKGGGVYVTSGNVYVNGTGKLSYNSAINIGGGAYIDGGNIQMTNGEIVGNTAVNGGGGFYVPGGTVTITGGDVKNNIVTVGNGGGFYSVGGTVSISNATISGNHADNGYGGGLYSAASITIGTTTAGTGATVSGNYAKDGAGFYVAGADDATTIIQSGSKISGNTASQNGAGVYIASGNLKIDDSSILSNTATANGGGVYTNGGTLTINGGDIVSNTAVNGGGVYSNGGTLSIVDGNLLSNTATNGGGVYTNGGTLSIADGELLSNIATNGGAGFVNGGTLSISDGNIDDNSATNGGGFYVNGGVLNLSGGTIGQPKGNQATQDGGGFYVTGGTANITNGIVEYNYAQGHGGGLFMTGTTAKRSTANFSNGTFQYNHADKGGGGIYIDSYADLKMSGESKIQNNYVPVGQNGGGVFKKGALTSLLWVSGKKLEIVNNYVGTSANRNNAYLDSYDDYITIDKDNGLGNPENNEDPDVSLKIGISVNVDDVQEDLPTPIIYCETADNLNNLFYMLKNPSAGNGVFDDAMRYSVVYQASPDPYNTNQIFFVNTWTSAVTTPPTGYSSDNIDSPEDLAWFVNIVNGTQDMAANPSENGNVTADIDMTPNEWTPIGEWDHGDPSYNIPDGQTGHKDKPIYTGTFEGNGHTITGLRTRGIVGNYNTGLFGSTKDATISNVVLADCDLTSGETARMGNLVGEMDGGTVSNCIVSGRLNPSGSETLEADEHYCVVGGLIGETKNNTSIKNCIATEEIEATSKDEGDIYLKAQAYTVGGLVGMTSANTIIENCFANPEIHHSGLQISGEAASTVSRYVGGLVGENYGTVKNCYVRLERANTLDNVKSKFGMFAGLNATDATVEHCFYPNEDLRHANITAYGADLFYSVQEQSTSTGHGQYNAVVRPYTYTSYLVDNQVDGGSTEATTLLSKLNDWVDDQTGTTYSHWMRTEGSDVNADYPVLSYNNLINTLNYTTVGSKDGINLEYDNRFNEMYSRFATEGEGCLFIYRTPWTGTIASPADEVIGNGVTVNNSGTDIKVFVEDGVALLQDVGSTLVNTYTCHEFNDASRSWHHISSSLNSDSPIGFNYTQNAAYNEESNPCVASVATGDYASFLPAGIPMADLDLYCFYETEYHWINFKRNTDSHWHMNDQHQNIAYTNEDNLVAGKGYLASFAGRTFVQAGGELTNGYVEIGVTAKAGSLNASASPAIPADEGTELKGYNLLGNPYQSYLDIAAFMAENSSLLVNTGKSGIDVPSYAIYDSEANAYVQGMASKPSLGSRAASGQIKMHEGFFIYTPSTGSAKFTNDMRCTPLTPASEKSSEQPAYPLVNLVVTDESGESDIAVAEFGRTQTEGAAKMKQIGADGKIYFHYADDDYALLYLNENTDRLPVHFDAIENGTYTMTWSTANATFSYLHLIDNMTGMDIDMLSSDAYTFTASSSDYKSRFKLMFAYTGVEENEAASTSSASFAFMHDGALTVNGEGMLEVIDMSGRTIVSSRLTDAQNTVSLPQAAQGVYVLRLTNDNQSKVQKIVIE